MWLLYSYIYISNFSSTLYVYVGRRKKWIVQEQNNVAVFAEVSPTNETRSLGTRVCTARRTKWGAAMANKSLGSRHVSIHAETEGSRKLMMDPHESLPWSLMLPPGSWAHLRWQNLIFPPTLLLFILVVRATERRSTDIPARYISE